MEKQGNGMESEQCVQSSVYRGLKKKQHYKEQPDGIWGEISIMIKPYHMNSIPGRENIKCQNHEAGTVLVCSSNRL